MNAVNEASRKAKPGPLAAMFDPPWTTVHTGLIEGGTAANITAKGCRFLVDFRIVPGDQAAEWEAAYKARVAEVEAEMQVVRAEAKITLTKRFEVPPLQPEEAGAAESLVPRLTGDNETHVVSYGTEAGHFQDGGYSTIVCGPGDIAQAHQPDEFIEIAQLEAVEAFMRRLVAELAS